MLVGRKNIFCQSVSQFVAIGPAKILKIGQQTDNVFMAKMNFGYGLYISKVDNL